ncbi:MAG: hypothetical protein IPK12_24550 [Gemmatimonadetes bacterium]|nr:hypothetical protein [Gemmatimonadota bacterium]
MRSDITTQPTLVCLGQRLKALTRDVIRLPRWDQGPDRAPAVAVLDALIDPP